MIDRRDMVRGMEQLDRLKHRLIAIAYATATLCACALVIAATIKVAAWMPQ